LRVYRFKLNGEDTDTYKPYVYISLPPHVTLQEFISDILLCDITNTEPIADLTVKPDTLPFPLITKLIKLR